MPLLKGNLHTHTTFSDGRRPIDEVLARYLSLGYDFVAITDHDDRIQDDYWFRIPPGDDRMLVLPGVELDYQPLGQHIGKVTGDRETLYILNHPARYTDGGVYQPEYDVETIALPKVATDDSHRDEDFGRAWVEVDAVRNADAILRAIKAGQFAVRFARPRFR
jgi:hypothetical protein